VRKDVNEPETVYDVLSNRRREYDMDDDVANPIDLSAEAALELEELKQNVRSDAPAMRELFDLLRTPSRAPSFNGNSSISMLADIRSYAVLRDALPAQRSVKSNKNRQEFIDAVMNYLKELEVGVADRNKAKLDEAKRFCVALNENLLAKRMQEIYLRRERADSRYVSHDSIS
jgi:hypothetical protein